MLIAALAWLLFPRSGAAWWALPAWIAYFGLSLTVWIYNVWQKLNFASR